MKRNRVRALLDLAPQLTEAERAAWQPPTQDWEGPEPSSRAQGRLGEGGDGRG